MVSVFESILEKKISIPIFVIVILLDIIVFHHIPPLSSFEKTRSILLALIEMNSILLGLVGIVGAYLLRTRTQWILESMKALDSVSEKLSKIEAKSARPDMQISAWDRVYNSRLKEYYKQCEENLIRNIKTLEEQYQTVIVRFFLLVMAFLLVSLLTSFGFLTVIEETSIIKSFYLWIPMILFEIGTFCLLLLVGFGIRLSNTEG